MKLGNNLDYLLINYNYYLPVYFMKSYFNNMEKKCDICIDLYKFPYISVTMNYYVTMSPMIFLILYY